MVAVWYSPPPLSTLEVMKDRFSDTSKQIYDNPEFDEIQNAIGQLEEIINRTGRGRHRDGGEGSSSIEPATQVRAVDDGDKPKHSSGKRDSSHSAVASDGDHGPSGASSAININNNNIIIPRAKCDSKSNGFGRKTGSQPNIANAITPTATISTTDSVGGSSSTAISKNDRNNKPIIIFATGNVANHIKPSPSTSAGGGAGSSGYRTYVLKKSTSSSAALSSPNTTTTTVILHTTTVDSHNNNRSRTGSSGNKTASEADSERNVRSSKTGIKANGISKKSMMESSPTPSSTSNHHASQPKVIFLVILIHDHILIDFMRWFNIFSCLSKLSTHVTDYLSLLCHTNLLSCI